MKAIILVFDQPERKIGSMSEFCYCIKNSSVSKAEKLLGYLKDVRLLPDDNVSLLKSSFFDNARQLLQELRMLVQRRKDEDLLFYYNGHGQRGGWNLGENKLGYGDKVIHYSELEDIFKDFNEKLIFFNECCYGLSLNPYLSKAILGRYLLLSGSRNRCVSFCNQSILDVTLSSWEHRKIARPKVYFTMINDKKDSLLDSVTPTRNPLAENVVLRPCVARCGTGCLAEGINWSVQKIFSNPRPSLRRGSDLDYLMYPPI